MFVKRLQNVDITVKNEASVELDMLESDDYYAYHGGLTAAVNMPVEKKRNHIVEIPVILIM